jgi:hypothetical protein
MITYFFNVPLDQDVQHVGRSQDLRIPDGGELVPLRQRQAPEERHRVEKCRQIHHFCELTVDIHPKSNQNKVDFLVGFCRQSHIISTICSFQ